MQVKRKQPEQSVEPVSLLFAALVPLMPLISFVVFGFTFALMDLSQYHRAFSVSLLYGFGSALLLLLFLGINARTLREWGIRCALSLVVLPVIVPVALIALKFRSVPYHSQTPTKTASAGESIGRRK